MKKTAQLIDCKALAEKILLELKGKVAKLDRPPGLATILVGNDPASHLYVQNKKKACQKVGIEFHEYLYGEKCYPNITEPEIIKMINWLNKNDEIDGIIIQLPLPKKFDTQKIINQLDPKKDVDGFHPRNKGDVIPPLIEAINLVLLYTKEDLKNKKVVIIARSPIFSNPLKKVLTRNGLRTDLVKPDDKNLKNKLKEAEILISVVGKIHFIKKSMVKSGAMVIDAGTSLISKNKWAGDVDPKVAEVAAWLTPVPGCIGPLTVAMLLKNTYELAKKS